MEQTKCRPINTNTYTGTFTALIVHDAQVMTESVIDDVLL